jgi:SNF2 family DNA or RNA helicase
MSAALPGRRWFVTFTDVRTLTSEQRIIAAQRAHDAYDIPLPHLAFWNYDPCPAHEVITHGCSHCGVLLGRHQRVGSAWMYLAGSGFLADSVGLGKTVTTVTVLAMLCETGEINEGRVVIVVKAAAVEQWKTEIGRMVPALQVITATGEDTPAQRITKYLDPWHVCIISPQTLAGGKGAKRTRKGDLQHLLQFDLSMVIYDDTDAMRNHGNLQAHAIKKLCAHAPRAYGLHGTPLQKRLTELHSFLEPVGGLEAFGNLARFKFNHVKQGAIYFYTVGLVCADDHLTPPPARRCRYRPEGAVAECGKPCWPDPRHRTVRRQVAKEIGVIHPETLKAKLHQLVLRRTAADVDDMALPAIQLNKVWLEPTAQQKARYAEVRQHVLRMLKESGEEISHVAAMAQYMRAWQICSGLASLDERDSVGSSVKLNWLLDRVTGDLSEEKVVGFINFTPNIKAMSERLTAADVGHVIIWGPESSARLREERRVRFRDDPECRVLLGTSSIEQSLDLQCSRHMVCCDTIPNPARMEQLGGRVKRAGSAYETVYMHMLLLRGTMEEGFLPLLEREQALADLVWDEQSPLFAALSPRQLLELVVAGGPGS